MSQDRAFGRVDAALNSLHSSLSKTTPSPIAGVYLKRYLDAANMHYTFAHQAFDANNHAEASTHFGHAIDALGAAHQVAHYNMGGEHPTTQAFYKHMSKVRSSLDDYRQATNTHDASLGQHFTELMQHNKLSPQQFS